jgi:hypothetical protein
VVDRVNVLADLRNRVLIHTYQTVVVAVPKVISSFSLLCPSEAGIQRHFFEIVVI